MTHDDTPGVNPADHAGNAEGGGGPRNASEVWDRLQALPSMKEDPLVWDHGVGGFVRHSDAPPPPPTSAPRQQQPPPPPALASPGFAATPMTPPAAAAAGATDAATRWRDSAAPASGPSGVGTDRPHVVINAAPRPPPSTPAAWNGPVAPPRPAPIPVSPKAKTKPAKSTKGGLPRVPGARTGRKIVKRLFIAFLLVPLLLIAAVFGFGRWKFGQIPRVDVTAAPLSAASPAGQNFLIVGTDSREGIDRNDPNAGALIGEPVSGSRTDSIMVLHTEGETQSLLSIPRDLWVTDPKTGQKGRINSTFEAGPTNLIRAVQGLGIPVHHYIEINFVSFGKLVDAVGGIDIDFPFAARDLSSGLDVPHDGVNHLDGTQALAYVRSRHYEELKANPKDAKRPIWVTDPRSDLGRVERQRAFLTALMLQVTSTRNPATLSNITGAMSVGLKLDSSLNFLDALKLGWKLKGFHPDSVSLPVTPRTTSGGAEVLDLKQAEAGPIITQFGG